MAKDTSLSITRRIKASPEVVWRACTKPDLIAQWMSPRAFTVCEVEADVRLGGRFAFRMTGEDGVNGAEGEYLEIIENHRLVLTWRWNEGPAEDVPLGVETLLTIELAPDRDGTLLTLTHAKLPSKDETQAHEGGWTEALDKLAVLVEHRLEDDTEGEDAE